jgi:elongation factor P--(R)-beta-lysine ligase
MALSSWHPEQFARRAGNLAVRQRVMNAMRAYFAREDFAEVDTPILQVSPGMEVHLQAFKTQLKGPRPDEQRTLYLHTSPEFAMKKLLVAGVPRLYQFAHTFRNGERSSRHHPEFLMLEWYRAHADIQAIMKDCIALVRAVAEAANRKTFQANTMFCDPFVEWETLSVPEAFERYADIDLLKTMADPYVPDPTLLSQEAQRTGVRMAKGDTWDDLFFRIMGEKIEPFLGKDRPTFLCDYPVSQAALARPKKSDPRLAERFELYICGIELANAFGELTNADEQLRRFKADMDLKEKLYGERYPVDDDFIAALCHGMPESAGIALGTDRLIMLCAGTETIEDVLWLPVAPIAE